MGLVVAVVAGALVAIGLCVFSVEPLWVLPVLEWITPNILYRVKTEKALVADLVRPDQRGTAYGLYNLAFSITVLPASLLMGAVWKWRGPTTAFLMSAVLGGTAALLLSVLVQTKLPSGGNAAAAH